MPAADPNTIIDEELVDVENVICFKVEECAVYLGCEKFYTNE